jgi:integrase
MSSPSVADRPVAKRVKVERNLYLRNDGIYEAGYTGSDGRWRIKTLGTKNLTEARKRLRAEIGKADRGEDVAPSKKTLADVWAHFEKTYAGLVATGERRERSLDAYRQHWRSYVEPSLGRRPVQKINASHVSGLLSELRQKNLAPWTLRAVWSRLDQLFSLAMTEGLISESPLRRVPEHVRPSGKSKSKPRTLTDEQCGQLIAAASERWRPLIATASLTGLRISELLGLRWQDVDFSEEIIRVRFQLSVARNGRAARLAPLKSESGQRDVYMLPELAKTLKRHKLASGHSQETDLVFCTGDDGKPLSQRYAFRVLAGAAENVGLSGEGLESLGWHDLRHTAISRLIAAGLDVVEVQRQAGHSKPSTTLDVYSHEFERAKRSEDVREKIARATAIKIGGAS